MLPDPSRKFANFVSPEKFFKDGVNFKKGTKQTYDISYREFTKYFKDIPVINNHHLVIGINFTYGWMPTIFDFRSLKFEESLEILNKAKAGEMLSKNELKTLKGLFNNSLVGTSKLLHFIAPEKFAIWDSRVYRYLKGQEPYEHRIGDCETYLSYLEFCGYLTSIKKFEKVHEVVCNELGYSMTAFRTVELVMYQNGGRAIKKKPNTKHSLNAHNIN